MTTDQHQHLKWWHAYLLTLAVLYLPTAFGFTADCPHCRETWLLVWPVLPGTVTVVTLSRHLSIGVDSAAGIAVAVVVTLALHATMVAVSQMVRPRIFKVTLGVAAVAHLLLAVAVYGAVRA